MLHLLTLQLDTASLLPRENVADLVLMRKGVRLIGWLLRLVGKRTNSVFPCIAQSLSFGNGSPHHFDDIIRFKWHTAINLLLLED